MKIEKWMILFSILVGFLIAEVGARVFKPKRWPRNAPYTFEDQKTLKEPNSEAVNLRNRPDGSVLFAIPWKFDEFGRRPTPSVPDAKRGHLFFGGSYTNGYGLTDDKTLPWLFSQQTGEQAYNYAHSAYGPQHMLKQLMDYDLNTQVEGSLEKIDATYFFYQFQNERVVGAFRWVGPYRVNDPYFDIEDGELKYLGNFAKGRPITTFVYWAIYHS
ncbi:MAG: hypothetical protein AAF202_12160, partial [Pseudomonadota bacterium]